MRFAGGGNSKLAGASEVKKSVIQSNLEGKKIRSLEGKLFTLNSQPSNPPTLLSSSNHSGGNASLIPPYGLKKKPAFTLAEVLITLGIIGIVAALTLPTLISNHKKQVYVTQLKKTVNTLQNGFKLVLAEDGVDSLKDTKLSEYVVNQNSNALRKYFNLAKDVEYLSANSREYKSLLISGASSGHDGMPSGVTSFGPAQKIGDCVLIVTADGAEICFPMYSVNFPTTFGVYVDVNGYNKLPNTEGYDYFFASFNSDGSVLVSGPELCGDGWSFTNPACFSRVISEGWKINY